MIRLILNLIWLVLAGIELFVAYVFAGLIMFVTVVGIPMGLQAFKLAGFALWPFGRAVVPGDTGFLHTVGNVIWLVLAGWWLAAVHVLTGIALCLTLIGIPMGLASFRMAGLALWPFGRRIIDRPPVGGLPQGSHTVR